uniref:Reverse transcriptase domain-containing protein n=1 Tax=Rhodnius prolixus TaxID=13249 RepID=T1HA21_RHOPR
MSDYMAYADDVTIIARSKTALRETFLELAEGAAGYGLKINEEKTKYMVTTRRARCFRELIVGQHRFEGVSEFKYPGAVLTNKNVPALKVVKLVATNRPCVVFTDVPIWKDQDWCILVELGLVSGTYPVRVQRLVSSGA